MPYTLVLADWDDVTDPPADTAITTFHFEEPVTPDPLADRNFFETAFLAFHTAIRDKLSPDVQLSRLRFFNVNPTPGGNSGPPIYTLNYTLGGTSNANRLPPQVACSITEMTAVRKRWGRFYLPGLTVAATNDQGRFTDGTVDQFASAANTFYDSMATSGRFMSVVSDATRAGERVTAVRVDDVPDIIRRRRFSATLKRTTYTVAAI